MRRWKATDLKKEALVEQVLKNRRPRGTGTESPPGCLAVFSLPFIASGAWSAGGAAGLWALPPRTESPAWMVGAAGWAFLLAGLAMAAAPVRAARRRAPAERARREHPEEPWLADHAWSGRGEFDGTPGDAAGSFVAAGAMALVLTPFHVWAFRSGSCPIPLLGVLGLFDLILLAIAGQAVHLALRWLRYGRPELRFRRFPFFLGEAVEAEFRVAADVMAIRKLVFTLRCVQERLETKENQTGVTVSMHEVWAKSWTVQPAARRVAVLVELPSDPALATELERVVPRYWELEVTGEAPGVDLGSRFLVPVYACPLFSPPCVPVRGERPRVS